MPLMPTSGDISDSTRDVLEAKADRELVRDAISVLPGGAPKGSYTIASGTIVPALRDHGGLLVIATEAAAATDDLDTITLTNLHDGQIVTLMAADAGDTVVCKHADGGSGELIMSDSADFSLDDADKFITLRRDGTQLVEIARGYAADTTAFRTRWDLQGGVLRDVQVYTSGTPTWTKPAWLRKALVEVCGGGGGGGAADNPSLDDEASAGAGGGGGGYACSLIDAASLSATEGVTVGALGNGPTSGNGGAGGASQFGTTAHLSATGGGGGIVGNEATIYERATGGLGGTGSVVTGTGFAVTGGDGQNGWSTGGAAHTANNPQAWAGNGGDSRLGGGSRGGDATGNSSTAGQDHGGYGGGGGGAASTNRTGSGGAAAGGDGGGGIVIVWEYS